MKTQETTAATTATKSSRKPEVSKAKAKAKANKAAKGSKSDKYSAKSEVRAGSKKEIVLKLLRRDQGATLAEIAKATDWQNHSIRGFVSGHVIKKMRLKVESTENLAEERTYRIVK